MYADAVWDHLGMDGGELSFKVGDVIAILDMTDDEWWQGSVGEAVGWFPASFVRLRIAQDEEEEDGSGASVDESVASVEADGSSDPNSSEGTGSNAINNKQGKPHAMTVTIVTVQSPSDSKPHPTTTTPKTMAAASPKAVTVATATTATESSAEPSHTQEQAPVDISLLKARPVVARVSVKRRMTIKKRDSTIITAPKRLGHKEVRAKIVEEILNTERNYVQQLKDIIEGYQQKCSEYKTLFDEEKIATIFSNAEEIYRFHRDFLRELEVGVNHTTMEESMIGEVFLNNRTEFAIYSEYCNNHPHAVNEMNVLQQIDQYALFFESCRLLQNLQDISLEGYLLTPVQKICKYPLQLTELLKYTSEEHPDHGNVVRAQEAMKDVAMLINERKRRMENIGKIGHWQYSIVDWKGEDVLATSTELIHSGGVHKISKGHCQERHFFLFDNQLVYCKDTLGGRLTYKGRLWMDKCKVVDLTDGEAFYGGAPLKNAWRMNNEEKDNKWYIMYAKSPKAKQDWMDAFKKERGRVEEDRLTGFSVSMKMKRAVVALCSKSAETRRRRRSFHKKHQESVDSALKNSQQLPVKRMKSNKKKHATGGSPSPMLNRKIY